MLCIIKEISKINIIDNFRYFLYSIYIEYQIGGVCMSEKEIAMKLLENVPAYKLGYVIAYLEGITADESSDDAFCESLCEEYEANPDKGQFVSFDEMAKMSGVDLNAI